MAKGGLCVAQAAEPESRTVTKSTAEPRWWIEPVATVVAFSLFVLYSAWDVLFHNTGQYQNYISPYFSPNVGAWLGIHTIPAVLVAWVPLFFRASCYYYRREYYRAFFWDPPACAIAERPRQYRGETKVPLVWNNLHRFFLYLAIIVVIFLWKDAVQAFIFPNGFGVGVGSLILLVNAILLTVYTFSCHAFRHLVGGGLDCFSCQGRPTARYKLWRKVSEWNRHHGQWAWISMFWVWGTGIYVRLLLMGVIHDVRFF
jgi:hypothetical protein